ncbi:MAG: GHKL domain-containing protein [Cyclobacteriaceae bacterium]|nr:MAG: GHKL domain-containing protein [Cyclobacteriaceae bacterium]
MNVSTSIESRQLPWWTWLAPFVVIHFASQLSLVFKYDQGVSTFYLPTAIAVVLINWWGFWRVVPAMYIVATLNTYYWGVEDWHLWPVFSASEVIGVTISYYLFRKVGRGKYWLPNTNHLIRFIFFALVIPITIELILLQLTLIYFSHQSWDNFGEAYLRNWLGEFMANFGIAIPLLFSVTPWLQQRKWLLELPAKKIEHSLHYDRKKWIETILIYGALVLLSITIPFEQYWFAYGIVSLYVAIRFGFGAAVFCNLFVFLITYVIPSVITGSPDHLFSSEDMLFTIFLGNLLLSLFVAITGRVISDLHQVEDLLHQQNQELENTNKELDRFVYSASHDLSAPLKSILGLVSISKLEAKAESSTEYLNEIELSVLKLESFIAEILDYSRNKRLTVTPEQIKLKALCQEILDNLKYLDNYNQINIDLTEIEQTIIHQDKVRLKIILSNLISNAIKFQKRIPGHKPVIKISSRQEASKTLIKVEDNGEGIPKELSPKIFEMFYRASDKASGSGLGLYIARESASKIGAHITHESEYGKGSVFTIELPEI